MKMSNLSDAKLKRGIRLHREGRLNEAKKIYIDLLKNNPKCDEAIHLLGLINFHRNNLMGAYELIQKAININPKNPIYHLNLGVVLQDLHENDKAINSYKKAIQLNNEYCEAYSYLGNVLRVLKRYDESIANHKMALKINSDYVAAYINLGVVYREIGERDKALNAYADALDKEPKLGQAWNNIAELYNDVGEYKDALTFVDKAIEINPNLAEAWSNRGISLFHLGNIDESITNFQKAIELNPKYYEAFTNKGLALSCLLKLEEAINCYDRAISINHEYADAHCNKSLIMLQMGNYENGWASYEWRFKLRTYIDNKKFVNEKLLNKFDVVTNKVIYLYAEQGLGDTIQFSRYVKELKKRGANIILEVQPSLYKLFSNWQEIDVLILQNQDVPSYDYHASLISLPYYFGTKLNNIPYSDKYIGAAPDKVQKWAEKIVNRKKLKIGLVWNGGFRLDQPELWSVNERRNISFSLLSSHINHLEMDFYSLQKGCAAEAEALSNQMILWKSGNFFNFVDEIQDFSDTAAIIENLDLVISVDTSTAHLAAALGKPTWILNRYDSCWRWLMKTEKSPWYDSVKLYRQTTFGNWDTVLNRLALDLEKLSIDNS